MDLFAAIAGPKWLKLLGLAGLPLLWFVAAGFHELGHVIGGWIGKGRFLLWLVGPFMVRRTPAGIRTGWNRSVNLTGGLAVCWPLDPEQVTLGADELQGASVAANHEPADLGFRQRFQHLTHGSTSALIPVRGIRQRCLLPKPTGLRCDTAHLPHAAELAHGPATHWPRRAWRRLRGG